jgi:hypothetical protein
LPKDTIKKGMELIYVQIKINWLAYCQCKYSAKAKDPQGHILSKQEMYTPSSERLGDFKL